MKTINPIDPILRLPQIIEATGLCRTAIWKREIRGEFPRRVSLGSRAVGWRQSDISTWLDSLRNKEGVK